MVRNDLTGKRFGRLWVVGFDRMQGKGYKWTCKCDCGNIRSIFSTSLVKKSGGTRSCGCFRREFISRRNVTHGNSFLNKITPEYRAWSSMKCRCDNPNNKRYSKYGGRGISYCKRWKKFENFLIDMGERPSKNCSLDRIDNNGNYSKSNCRWATVFEQNANRHCVTLITAYGKSMTAGAWARIASCHGTTIARRIKRGISPEDAIGHINPSAL